MAEGSLTGNSNPTGHEAMHDKQHNLQSLLTTFNATSLGEGDTNAGANTLAAMLVTLANLARPGSGIMTNEGRLIPVGCDLLATGSLVADMILDGVVAPVGRC